MLVSWVLLMLPSHGGRVSSIITVEPGIVTHTVAPQLNGCHFSPLDHQLFTVYSQLIYDESFEQSISDKGGLSKEGPGNTVDGCQLHL